MASLVTLAHGENVLHVDPNFVNAISPAVHPDRVTVHYVLCGHLHVSVFDCASYQEAVGLSEKFKYVINTALAGR